MEKDFKQFSVAVVIAAYNAAKYLPRAINSVIAQTMAADEIIVVDDGSTDNTREAISSFGDRVKYIYQPNAGPGAARNTGIQAAVSEWISFLDADDEYLPNKLETQINILKHHPDLTWVSGNYIRCICESNRRVPLRTEHQIEAILKARDYFEDFLNAYFLGVFGCMDTMFVKRKALIDAGMFRSDLARSEDTDLWLRIAYVNPAIGFTAAPLSIYHMRPESLVSSCPDLKHLTEFVDRHLQLAKTSGRLEQYTPCARKTVVDWMRAALFDTRVADVPVALDHYRLLIPTAKRTVFRILSLYPKATLKICRSLSYISRKFNLRKKNIHPGTLSSYGTE